ncbi:hypothetical protein [Streptomyces sp. TS71-3]|uniref:hypothetical protein n=1 Tax=Streptomyces sp. TS71-3 TaxID=2733862 RepID=UPI001B02EADE|nr:hypothetical protein [Streptomyces sp. TS71-3]GHJ36037.1 hypothetical protein Sm713_16460 [Streptomyces sp. TS71-3]
MNDFPLAFLAPEIAYADAPSIVSEIGWIAATANDPDRRPMEREFWLRKAAVLDRIAVYEAETYGLASAAEAGQVAELAACRLAELDYGDRADTTFGPPRTCGDQPRRQYVRLAYLTWRTT